MMTYEEYVDYCLDIYQSGLKDCPQTDLWTIVAGNLDKAGCGYDEDVINDLCYSIKAKIK